MRLVILEAESLGKDMDLSGFSRFGEVTVYEKTTEEECPERVREADIVICNKVRMCSRTLSGAENLKLICVTATGINNIDLDYVKRHNIAVTNVAGYSTVSVAQHTFAPVSIDPGTVHSTPLRCTSIWQKNSVITMIT